MSDERRLSSNLDVAHRAHARLYLQAQRGKLKVGCAAHQWVTTLVRTWYYTSSWDKLLANPGRKTKSIPSLLHTGNQPAWTPQRSFLTRRRREVTVDMEMDRPRRWQKKKAKRAEKVLCAGRNQRARNKRTARSLSSRLHRPPSRRGRKACG